LLAEIRNALQGERYEVLVVDDGSSDRPWSSASCKPRAFAIAHPAPRTLAGPEHFALHAAQAARGRWLATLDGDGQNDPADIPGMLALVRASEDLAGGIKLVAGHRVNRRDTASKRWASRFANGLRSRLLKDATPDTGCGLKLIERAAFLRLPYFDHMHRYIPALILRHNGRMLVHR
jgi:dolichol-phosphate mannosyltransferase